MCTEYKIIHGTLDVNRVNFFKPVSHEHNTRGSNFQLFKTCTNTNTPNFFFTSRIINY